MDILLSDVSAKVAEVLAQLKSGVETARAAGLIAELPEKVDFQMNIITAVDALSDVTTETDRTARTTATTVAAGSQTEGARTDTIGAVSRTEGARTDTVAAGSRTEGARTDTVGAGSRTEGAQTNTEQQATDLTHETTQTGGSGENVITTYSYKP